MPRYFIIFTGFMSVSFQHSNIVLFINPSLILFNIIYCISSASIFNLFLFIYSFVVINIYFLFYLLLIPYSLLLIPISYINMNFNFYYQFLLINDCFTRISSANIYILHFSRYTFIISFSYIINNKNYRSL